MNLTGKLSQSPMQQVEFAGYQMLIKRDDLLSHHFSGNKARKLGYFLEHDFPDIQKIMGYGSVQANSLYSLAALAKIKNWQLDFFVHRIPEWLKNTPIGNYEGALMLGANIIEKKVDKNSNLDTEMRKIAKGLSSKTLFIPEGGRCEQAKYGIRRLANELIDYCQHNKITKPLFMLPSGTGTTALYLQTLFRESQLHYRVFTCACVGGDKYLQKQFSELSVDSENWPTILPTKKKYHFSKLYPEFYHLWQQLKQQTQVEFDLLYDPLGWQTLLTFLKDKSSTNEVIYIHQGGLVGNQSMLLRYQRKFDKI